MEAASGHACRARCVTDITRSEEIGRAHSEAFATIRPAASMIEVRALIDPRLLIEIEADAIIGDQDGRVQDGHNSRNHFGATVVR
jgi:hypothetical protein